MKGLIFLGNSKLEVREFPDPVPGPTEVVIQIKTAGICGSDLHFFHPQESPSFIQGHEGAGIVHAVGDKVSMVKVGDRVSIYHWLGCGECHHCLSGYVQQCEQRRGMAWQANGCDADFAVTDQKYCLKLPDELTFTDGSFIGCGGGTAFSIVSKLNLSADSRLVIFGAGPLGLASMLMAKGHGANITMVDFVDSRLEFAKKAGADSVINARKVNVVEAVKDLTNGRGANKLLDTSARARADAVECAATNATIGLVGMRHNDYYIDFDHFIRKQLTFIGSYVFPITLYPTIRDFMVNHEIHFDCLVTRTFKLEQAEEAYRLFETGSDGKFMFVW